MKPNMRLQEAELAKEMGIPFDHRWYSIDKTVREYMIAERLANTYISNLAYKEAKKEAK